MILPDVIPGDLRAVAVPLSALGVDDVAWRGRDALRVVVALRGTSIAVVGGELYRSEAWGIAPVAEGWRCARFGSELATSYAERTRETATRYIEESLARHGDGVLYALQFSTQQDAA